MKWFFEGLWALEGSCWLALALVVGIAYEIFLGLIA
jgi:hypothetical protein